MLPSLLLLMMLGSGREGWAMPPAQLLPTKPTQEVDLLADLLDGREGEQIFAARELRRQVEAAIRQLYFRDEVMVLEARQSLARFDEALAPLCIEVLERPSLTVPCADILGALETQAALPVLRDALEGATKRGVRRHLAAAIAAIEQGQSGSSGGEGGA